MGRQRLTNILDFANGLTLKSRRQPAASPASGVRRVLGNFAHLLGGKAAAGVVSAIYLVIITRALGVSGYGVLVLVNAYAVLVATIVAYSGFQGVVRYGAIALEAGDTARFARVVRFMVVIELGFGALAIAVAAVLAPVIGPRLGWSHETVQFAILYSLAVLATVRATPQGVLQIARRFDLIGLHQTVSPFVRLGGALAVRAFGGGLTDYLTVWLAASVIEGLSMWLLAYASWRKLAPQEKLLGPWRGVLGQGDGFGKFAIITKFEITLRELAPKLAPLVVGWVLGPAGAGVFALALRGTSLLAQPALLLGRAIYPVLAAQNARRELGDLWRTVWRSVVMATAASAPIVALLGLFGAHVLPMLGGRSFRAGAGLLVLIALSRAASIAGAPIAAGLTALGRPQRSMIAALAANVGLFPLLPVLMWKFGVAGAGWHALIQGVLSTALLALFFARDAKAPAPGEAISPEIAIPRPSPERERLSA